MISVEFFSRGGRWTGFCIEGHSDASEAGTDIVCAAVSSAAYLTANTVTDVLRVSATAESEDGKMVLQIYPEDASECQTTLQGLWLHLNGLREQYPENIMISNTEV
jgi:uncharacterized protein